MKKNIDLKVTMFVSIQMIPSLFSKDNLKMLKKFLKAIKVSG